MTRFYHAAVILLSFSCFLLSSRVPAQMPTVRVPTCQEDATISVAFSGLTEVNTCTDDDINDRLRFQVSPFAQAFGYVVVDDDDIIQSIGFSNFINFDFLPPGQLRVYGFSTYGRITAEVGDDFTTAELSRPCFGLTTNFVRVLNGQTGTTDIATPSGETEFTFCPGDGRPDEITFTGATNTPGLAFVVTDTAGIVLAVNTSGTIDFDGAEAGICRVYALGFVGELSIEPGDDIADFAQTGGCGGGASESFITVVREEVDGGRVTTLDGATRIEVCPQDGRPDTVRFATTGNTGTNTAYIVTDGSNVIIGLPTGNLVDFDPAPVGICRVWSVSYEGELVARLGEAVADSPLADGCARLSDNFVEVTRTRPDPGTVATTDGATEVVTCPGDGVDDIILVTAEGNSGGDLAFVITNEADSILGISVDHGFNVEGAGVGNCRIYSIAYRGTLNEDASGTLSEADLASECFEVSENFVNIIREVPMGGTVATTEGATDLATCPGDGVEDLFTFTSEGASGGNFAYVVTDDNNVIIGLPPGNEVNFEDAEVGTCRVWGLSYQGDLLAMLGDNAAETELASGCFSLSENFVTVVREVSEGGTISIDGIGNSASVCPNDGIADSLTFLSQGASGDNFTFIVTDDAGIVLVVPAGATVDFENTPTGTCRVYGLSYSGDLLVGEGDDIATATLASACPALSTNFVTVVREDASTGSISTEDGATEVVVCPGDNIPDAISFDSTGTSLERFTYLVTDTNNVVIEIAFTDRINFENSPAGICRVWGLGYNGIIQGQPGDVAGVDQLATECNALSENFVTVIKSQPDGGRVTTSEGDTLVNVCPMDGVSDAFEAVAEGASGPSFTFVVTTDDNEVLAIQESNAFDFDDATIGTCRIYGLSYQGDLLLEVGSILGEEAITTGCSDLSDNWITVIREDVMGGTISLLGGATEITTCPGDGVNDLVVLESTGATGANFLYIITDANNVILETSQSDTIDFELAGEGVCRVWGLAYAGEANPTTGDRITETELATGCNMLSDNFVTVTRQVPIAGTITDGNGENFISICGGDGVDDVVSFVADSSVGNYAFLIVQDSLLLTVSPADSFDFNNAISGTFLIYGLAYAGELDFNLAQNIFTEPLATSCQDLTETPITIEVTAVDGGRISSGGQESLFFCPENDDDGFASFESTSSLRNENYTYVVATTTDVILGLVDSNSFDFSAVPLEELRVYAISYTGDLLAGPGTSLFLNPLATGCAGLSENFIPVTNVSPQAGSISSPVEATGISCSANGDGTIEVIPADNSRAGYAILVTDTANVLQLVAPDPAEVDLGSLPPGTYRLHGLSFTGSVVIEPGENIDVMPLADNCYELTEEFITIEQAGSIEAGTLTNLTNEGDEIIFCETSEEPQVVIVQSDVTGPNYRYLVTDGEGDIIVSNLTSNIISFEPFRGNSFRVYGYNFTGRSLATFNRNVETDALSDSCFAVTTNFITVTKITPDGGMITSMGETEIEVVIEGEPDSPMALATFETTSDSLYSFAYVITDTANVILGLSQDATIDFGPAGPGICRVWGLEFTGEVLVGVGVDVDTTALLTDGCFDLSDDFVTVTRVEDAGLRFPQMEPGVDFERAKPEIRLSAFPNPTSGNEVNLSIEGDRALPDGRVLVRDMDGRAYDVQFLYGGQRSAQVKFDLSELPPGIYFIQYRTAEGNQSIRFVKQ